MSFITYFLCPELDMYETSVALVQKSLKAIVQRKSEYGLTPMNRFVYKAIKEFKQQYEKSKAEQQREAKFTRLKDLALLALAVVTGILAFFQIYIGCETVRTTNRAYLSASPWRYGMGSNSPVIMALENIGQSPAYNIIGSHVFQVVPDISGIQEFNGIDESMRAFLGKDDTVRVKLGWDPPPSEATSQRIHEGDSVLVLVGDFGYDNIFDEHCILEYCFIWQQGGKWQPCDGKYQKPECD